MECSVEWKHDFMRDQQDYRFCPECAKCLEPDDGKREGEAARTKTITLTLKQWETIVDALEITQDEGPIIGAGSKSDELSQAEAAMNQALEAAPVKD